MFLNICLARCIVMIHIINNIVMIIISGKNNDDLRFLLTYRTKLKLDKQVGGAGFSFWGFARRELSISFPHWMVTCGFSRQ